MRSHRAYRRPKPAELSRRTFIRATALIGGGVLWGWTPPALHAASLVGAAGLAPGPNQRSLTPWILITPDNQVTLIVSQAELGQGISTTLPAILADELGADWGSVRLETAPYAPSFRNPKLNWMFTGNSESVQSFHDLMRQVGAAARTMLVQAAAVRWQVPPTECVAAGGAIRHVPTNRRLTFGAVVDEAAQLPVPQRPPLKPRADLTLRGRSIPRVDVPSKVDGSAVFGIDVHVPGMLAAAIRRPPTIGGLLRSVDEGRLKAQPGVRDVVRIDQGVAVVAQTYLQARRALAAVPPVFDAGPNAALDSASLRTEYQARLENGPFATAVDEGDALGIVTRAERRLVQEYENPFAAHATMEPMNCTASVTPERCEVWAPTQGQEFAFVALKAALGMSDHQVIVNRSAAIGGGFGRRLLPDFVVQAALVSKAVGAPVKLIWDREEDMRHDYYRPATAVRLSAAVDATGTPAALVARIVSPTILLPVFPPIASVLNEKGIDPSALEGMLETDYAIPARRVDFHLLKTPIPTSVMRTTGYGPNIFALESFVDELAAAAKLDPYRYRRRLLVGNARAIRVLDRAAALGNWSKPLRPGHGRGIAYAFAFGTRLAMVTEVEVAGDAVKVKRVTTVVDCGEVLDRKIAEASIEGGVVFGLGYCKTEITFKEGRAEQDNFDGYELPYLAETPVMVTEFIEGGPPLGGIGEVSPVTVPPALVNAIHAATGKRLRSLPLRRHGQRFA